MLSEFHNTTTAYTPKTGEIAGFELCGMRDPETNEIVLGTSKNGTRMDEFPDEVEVAGRVYTLESIDKQRETTDLEEDHPGYWMEWGVYV